MGKKGRQMTELILQTWGHKSEEKNSDETGLKERQRRLKKEKKRLGREKRRLRTEKKEQ